MKVQLIKRAEWDRTWYITMIDGVNDHFFLNEEDARRRYNEIIQNGKKPPVSEILKEEEV